METQPVAARVHKSVAEWLEELAEEEATTVGRIVEDKLREAYQEESGSQQKSGNSLPEGVYVPNSDKHNYAVKFTHDRTGETRRRYYKTREGAIKGANRLR